MCANKILDNIVGPNNRRKKPLKANKEVEMDYPTQKVELIEEKPRDLEEESIAAIKRMIEVTKIFIDTEKRGDVFRQDGNGRLFMIKDIDEPKPPMKQVCENKKKNMLIARTHETT